MTNQYQQQPPQQYQQQQQQPQMAGGNNYQRQAAPAYQGTPAQGGGGGQYEKNPNGGYLNPSNYGADAWYGAITITPDLLPEIQASGKVLIEVKDVQVSEYGPCRRIVAKPYQPREAANAGPQPQQQQQYQQPQQQVAAPMMYQAPPQPAASMTPGPIQPQPSSGQAVLATGGDEIPF